MVNSFCRVFVSCVFLVFYGCATHASDSNERESVISAYEQYLAELERNTSLSALAKYWSKEANYVFSQSETDGDENNAINFHHDTLRYPMLFEPGFFEVKDVDVEDQKSCLLLIGKAMEGDFLTLNVAFILDGERWLHTELFAYYFEDATDLPAKSNCVSARPPHL